MELPRPRNETPVRRENDCGVVPQPVFGIGALKLFDQPFLVAGGASGNPNYATMYPILYIYNAAFGVYDFGLAAAAGVIYFVIVFGLTVVQRLTVGRQEVA